MYKTPVQEIDLSDQSVDVVNQLLSVLSVVLISRKMKLKTFRLG
jgi:hypothetical protein